MNFWNKLLVLCFYGFALTSHSGEGNRNVVILFIDNHGYYELSRNGHQIVQTPHIDALSESGINFTNFHAPPFCSPSRAALLTGRYALRAGIHNTIGGVSILNKNETTIADLLKDEGYRTAIFGKWHLGMSYPYLPDQRGFEEYFIHGGGGVSQLEDYYGNHHADATYLHNGHYVKSRGFSTDVLFDQGIDFIKRNRENNFFCMISTPAVHFPTLKHPETTQRLKDRGVPDSNQLALYSMIENVDDNVGRMISFLEESGLKENTLLILASDQGVNDRGAKEHRSGQGFINRGVQYDEKHHVYCMLQHPDASKQGPDNTLTGMVDLFPTILDYCGLSESHNLSLDGQSLAPLIENNNAWNKERILIVQCPRERDRSKWDKVSIKYQDWRLVDGKELYNTKNDFGQTNNLYDPKHNIVKHLSDAYETFWNNLPSQEELTPDHILGSINSPEVKLNAMDWYKGSRPWTQQILSKSNQQGLWKVTIDRKGTYLFELRRYPREAGLPHGAEKAQIAVGNNSKEVETNPDSNYAKIKLNLQKGTYDLKSTFINSDQQWGAYYVYIKILKAD